jgi:hypothetical protein
VELCLPQHLLEAFIFCFFFFLFDLGKRGSSCSREHKLLGSRVESARRRSDS